MKEGFYYYRGNIYYGCYDEKQASLVCMVLR